MIFAVTDGKKMTDKIGDFSKKDKRDDAVKHYKAFYDKHFEVIKRHSCNCNWNVIKSTGDGLLFYTETINYSDCIYSLITLHNELQKINYSRLFFFYCSNTIKGSEINAYYSFKNDFFGHEMNLGFRLLSIAKGNVLFTEDRTLKLMYYSEPSFKNKEAFYKEIQSINVIYTPIPITYLKGIKNVGFGCKRKKPYWIWEIQYQRN